MNGGRGNELGYGHFPRCIRLPLKLSRTGFSLFGFELSRHRRNSKENKLKPVLQMCEYPTFNRYGGTG
jgi:hypothetical protein